MLKEFKTFIARGNVIDMAVGIVVGAAFTAIVTSLVSDIITPFIGMAMGGMDFSTYYIDLSMGGYATLEEAKAAGAPIVMYGLFFNAIIKFLIVAFAVFMLVKQINRLKAAPPSSKDAPPAPEDIQLLREIRDALQVKPMKAPVKVAAAKTKAMVVKSAVKKKRTAKKTPPKTIAAKTKPVAVKSPVKKKATKTVAAKTKPVAVKAPVKKKVAAKKKVAKKPATKAKPKAKPAAKKPVKAVAKKKPAAKKK